MGLAPCEGLTQAGVYRPARAVKDGGLAMVNHPMLLTSRPRRLRKVPMPVRKRTFDLAREYVDKHFGVRVLFPIKPGQKFPPLFRNNLELASSDTAQLKAWEEKWPGCNWGVAHRKSKLMVVNVD